jgi:hypothetical protein
LYPCYDTAVALRTLAARLGEARADDRVAFLVERANCNWYRRATEAGLDGIALRPTGEAEALRLEVAGSPSVLLIAGRQIATAERMEVLALATLGRVADGLPVEQTVQAVLDVGGVPVLAWAPGKWMFSRTVLSRRVFEAYRSRGLLLGDTSLRPALAPQPGLMAIAQACGVPVLAGSDPLPFPGEERRMGQYLSVFECDVEANRPAAALRKALLAPGLRVERSGRRSSAASVAVRLFKNFRSKR